MKNNLLYIYFCRCELKLVGRLTGVPCGFTHKKTNFLSWWCQKVNQDSLDQDFQVWTGAFEENIFLTVFPVSCVTCETVLYVI